MRKLVRTGGTGIDDTTGYRIVDLMSLSRRYEGIPGERRKNRYRRVASNACGDDVATDSLVVFTHFPRAPFANLAPAAHYVVRTNSGWRAWYEFYPRFGTHGFLEP